MTRILDPNRYTRKSVINQIERNSLKKTMPNIKRRQVYTV